jgi:hypothetical protein
MLQEWTHGFGATCGGELHSSISASTERPGMYQFITKNMRLSRYLSALCIYDDPELRWAALKNYRRDCLHLNVKTDIISCLKDWQSSPTQHSIFSQQLEEDRKFISHNRKPNLTEMRSVFLFSSIYFSVFLHPSLCFWNSGKENIVTCMSVTIDVF